VIHVEDGDTVTVRSPAGPIRVRLEGIDAPELDQRFGLEARNYLRTLVFDRTVEARPTGMDQYDRLLARLVADGRDVCELMVAAGWAWHYREYSNDARLSALERQARAGRRGLWADPEPRAPWEERARGRRDSGRPPTATPTRDAEPSSGPFHGNVKSRVYHAPGCRDYHCANCTAVFATREAAEAAGFRPHAACVK